jgi:hypothetical protein
MAKWIPNAVQIDTRNYKTAGEVMLRVMPPERFDLCTSQYVLLRLLDIADRAICFGIAEHKFRVGHAIYKLGCSFFPCIF